MKNIDTEKYPVYLIGSECCYFGISLVAANSIEEANNFIRDYKIFDSDNIGDSKGYSFLTKYDEPIDGLYSEYSGIVHYGIHYGG